MKIQYQKLYGIIFFFLIFLFSIFFCFFKKEAFSENENRVLEKSPKFTISNVLDGSFMKSFETYSSDHFPFRNFFLGLKTKMEKELGKEVINNVYYGKEGYLLEKYQKPTHSDQIVESLNEFYQNLNYVNMTLMLVPTSIVVNEEKLPSHAPTYSQVEEMKKIYDQIKFDTIDLTETLKKGNLDYPMFYHLDHHWTSYGAYYAYLAYCNSLGITPIDITQFEIKEVSNQFRGTLYSKVLDSSLKPDSIHMFQKENTSYQVYYVKEDILKTSLYEESYLKKKDQYSYFLDNNHPLIEITNNNLKNGKELLVLKDSFANSIIPFLVEHYEKVHVIDPRFYKDDIIEYVKEHKNLKDVLILYNMNTIDTDLGIRTIN